MFYYRYIHLSSCILFYKCISCILVYCKYSLRPIEDASFLLDTKTNKDGGKGERELLCKLIVVKKVNETCYMRQTKKENEISLMEMGWRECYVKNKLNNFISVTPIIDFFIIIIYTSRIKRDNWK